MWQGGQIIKFLIVLRFPHGNELLRSYHINVCRILWYFKKMKKEESVSFETPIRIYNVSQETLHVNEDRVPVHAMKAFKGEQRHSSIYS